MIRILSGQVKDLMTKMKAIKGAMDTNDGGIYDIKVHPVVAQLPPPSSGGVGQLPTEVEPSDGQELKHGCEQGQVDPDHPMDIDYVIDDDDERPPLVCQVASAAPTGDREYALPAGGACHEDWNMDEQISDSVCTKGGEHPVVAQLPSTSVDVGQLPAEDAPDRRTAAELKVQIDMMKNLTAQKLPLSDQIAGNLEYDMAVKEHNNLIKLYNLAEAREHFETCLNDFVYYIRPPRLHVYNFGRRKRSGLFAPGGKPMFASDLFSPKGKLMDEAFFASVSRPGRNPFGDG